MTEVIETSPVIDELAKALPAAQAAVRAVVKDANNPHFGRRYVSLAEVRDAVVPALTEHGFSVTQHVTTEAGAVKVTTWLLHTSAQWMRSTHVIPVLKVDAQGVGSALTYAKRQALQALFCVAAPDEDDDGEGAVGRGAGRPPLPPAEPPKRADLKTRAKKLLGTLEGVKTVRDLDRAWDLGKALRDECATDEPPLAAVLDDTYGKRRAAMIGDAG